jgi:hypothetical protein
MLWEIRCLFIKLLAGKGKVMINLSQTPKAGIEFDAGEKVFVHNCEFTGFEKVYKINYGEVAEGKR